MEEGSGRKEAFASGKIEIVSTSGTSEDRVSIVWDQAWWDRSEREAARLNSVLDGIFRDPHREAVLTTPLCAGNLCHVGEVSMEDRTVGNLLFLNQSPNPTSWNGRTVRRIAEELGRFRPRILEADPAYLSILSRQMTLAGIVPFQPACIVLTYEFPSRLHYRWILRAFPGVPVVSSYGSTEAGHVFTQCEAGTFHQNTATSIVEVQPLRPGRGDPEVGRLLVGTLDNPWFTLLRFDVGDLVRLRRGPPCPCGRTGGLDVAAVEGRVRDLTFDQEGFAVPLGRLDGALEAVDGLVSYAVEQPEPLLLRAGFVSEPGREKEAASGLEEALHGVYGGGVRVELRREAAIPPEPSGKFRLARASFPWSAEELFQ